MKIGAMKKVLLLLILFSAIAFSCATTQPRQEPTLLMSSEAKIQYYQEQITRYQFLIDQEKKKIESKK
jgi:hypothetical protein